MFPKEQYQERPFRCTGPISYTGHSTLQRDIDNLKAAVDSERAPAGLLPVVAPASAAALCPNEYYKTDEEYIYAIAEALRVEYKTILDAGLLVQIDDATLPFLYARLV